MQHVGKTALITEDHSTLPCGHSQANCNVCSTIGILCHAACQTCGATYRITEQHDTWVEVIGVRPEDACPTLTIPTPKDN